jgi:hypothetical protein
MDFKQKVINILPLLTMMSRAELVKLKMSAQEHLRKSPSEDQELLYCAVRILLEKPDQALEMMR